MELPRVPLTYSIVTTCKGRLQNLQRSLPTFLAQLDAEIVVVDYDCPQGAGSWVQTGYRLISPPRGWNASTMRRS